MFMAASLSDHFAHKRLAIVGGAQGHGFAIAEGCARNGAEVLLLDHDPAIADAAARLTAAGLPAAYRTADVTAPGTVKTALDELAGQGPIDGLIYLPRGRVRKSWNTITPDDWHTDLDTALAGAFFCVQAAFPYLCRSTKHPFVITLSSILSDFAGNESAGYHAAKGGLDSLTRYLAVQLGPLGIRVNTIQMGWIIKDQDLPRFHSDDNRRYRESAIAAHPLRRVGYTQDVLNSILFLGSDQASFLTGQILRLDGGLTLQEHTHLLQRMTTPT